jgi:glycosyltransferase involved in cell wall biosynthesis
MMSALSAPRLIGWSKSSELDVRPDLLVHALAQLPEGICLEVADDGADTSHLALLATAYGIVDRVTLTRTGSPEALPLQKGEEPPTMAELVEGVAFAEDPPARCPPHDELLAGERIGLVTNLPAPYRIPLFNAMARRLHAVGATFRVFFLAPSAQARPWMNTLDEELVFEYEVLSSVAIPLRARRPLVPLSLERRLGELRPTQLLSAGFSPLVSGRVAAFAKRRHITFGLWSGEHGSMPTARSPMRRVQRRRLLAAADFAIAYGHEAGEYLRAMRCELPCVYGRNSSVTDPPIPEGATTPSVVTILAVGDLASPRKGTDVLVDALGLAPDLACRLTVVGGGKLLPQLKRRAADDERICFFGSVPPATVRTLYREADVFAFPSRADVFGLALVEAMASGLAVATSASPGAVADLCLDERNCLIVPSHDPEAWRDSLARLVRDAELRRLLGQRAYETVARRWTIDHAADAMLAGLRLGVLVRTAGVRG